MESIRIGSRGSKLAVTQTEWVGHLIKSRFPSVNLSFHQIKTTGDRDRNSTLASMGGKGVFVKEIEDALLEKKIDLAVHSLKDVPQNLPHGLVLAAAPLREDPRDAFVSRFGELLRELPKRSTIGTGSPRRAAQILQKYKNRYNVKNIRGNVETRLKKVQDGEFDGTILAAAGLKRLGLYGEITEIIETDVILPAPCQGCLGLEIREDDLELEKILKEISDEPSDIAARTERAFLQGVGGSCALPVAGLAIVESDVVKMKASIYDPRDHSRFVSVEHQGPSAEPALVGGQLAELMLREGASEILMNLPEPVIEP